VRKVNGILFIVSFLYLLGYLFQAYVSSKKIEFIYSILEKQNDQHRSILESIRLLNANQEYFDQHTLSKYDIHDYSVFPERYQWLRYNQDSLNSLHSICATSCGLYLDEYGLKKDYVSEEFSFGFPERGHPRCSEYKLRLNGDLQKIGKSNFVFTIAKEDSINLEFIKYETNYRTLQLDTISVKRHIYFKGS